MIPPPWPSALPLHPLPPPSSNPLVLPPLFSPPIPASHSPQFLLCSPWRNVTASTTNLVDFPLSQASRSQCMHAAAAHPAAATATSNRSIRSSGKHSEAKTREEDQLIPPPPPLLIFSTRLQLHYSHRLPHHNRIKRREKERDRRSGKHRSTENQENRGCIVRL